MGISVAEYRQLLRAGKSKSCTTDSDNPTEYTEGCDLSYKLNELMDDGKILQYSHISNETFTKSWNVKRKNKAQGVRSGIPDYVILLPGKTVWIELKRKKGGCVSPEQKAWITAINQAGGHAAVCKGADMAIKYLETLL